MTTAESERPLVIRSGQGDYPVDFLDAWEQIAHAAAAMERPVVFIDRRVASLYPNLIAALPDADRVMAIDATEDEKTFDGVGRAFTFLQHAAATKNTPLIAIGGGIIQDIATFVAHAYYRGIRWYCVPTTLLGMADSSIGAKCGINLGPFKNQLGVFHSPAGVLTWLPFVKTLAARDVTSGYGEVLKLHLTGAAPLFDELASDLDAHGTVGNPHIERHVRESLRVKQSVIEADEYEADLRRVLNYGHTFGHALEAATRHEVPHGMAVAWGIDVANYVSMRLDMLDSDTYERIHGIVERHFAFPVAHPLEAGALVTAMHRDKKASSGRANFILSEGPGRLRIKSLPLDATLTGYVSDYLVGSRVLSRR